MDIPAAVGGGEQRRKFFAQAVEALCAFAEAEFRDNRRLSDGATERDHASSAAAQLAKLGKKKKVAAVDGPEYPDELDHVWRWFCEHSMGLEAAGMGPPTVTWQGLQAWATLMQIELEPWESQLMVRLGHLRASITSENPKPGEK